jgi:UDP-N-acetylmuramoyl-L-alanyl-D-glutamate--2,6-diaminopimelate ligase
MMLSELIPEEIVPHDVQVTGITDDSRRVARGDLFLARPGGSHDGRAFIAEVADRAAAILCESPAPVLKSGNPPDVPIIELSNLEQRTGDIANRFYGRPSEKLRVVAVTGTNGKTSVTNYVAAAAATLGAQCGVIGTLGSGTPGALNNPGLTTPDAISLQRSLAALVDEDCSMVAIEASSHGLEQGRLNGVAIDIGVFTNLTRDHMDYHGSLADYVRAKRRLFEFAGVQTAVVNKDDPQCDAVVPAALPRIYYGFKDADVTASSIEVRPDGVSFELRSPWGTAQVDSPLLGRFNISNLLATTGVLGSLGYDAEHIAVALSTISNVDGRMQAVKSEGCPLVVIDYAHTPDALEKALHAVREHCAGGLWCVFGCGGNRDAGKRPLMGAAAESHSDHVVLTDDNPRDEKSADITDQVMAGMSDSESIKVILNREDAIAYAISRAEDTDVVLVAGKGHETYQEIGGERQYYSDHEVVARCLSERLTLESN